MLRGRSVSAQPIVPLTESEPLSAFREWRGAVDAAAALRDAMKGRHVRFVGMLRNASHQPTGRIRDVTAAGFKIRWDGSTVTEWIDPESVIFI
jgi:hypothetical protein